MIGSVSVALCTYNGAAFIAEQLRSIVGQSRPPDQLVVCDDGSSDATLEIVRDLARTSSVPIEVAVHPVRLGVTRNFEAALARCTGEVIFLADQDDLWASHKIARVCRALDDDDSAGFAFSDAALVDRAGRELGKRLWDVSKIDPAEWAASDAEHQLERLLAGANLIYGNTLAFRSRWIGAVLPIALATRFMTHDTWIAVVLCALGARGIALADPLVRYRQHDDQVSGGMIAKSPLAFLVAHHSRSRRDEFAQLAAAYEAIIARVASQPVLPGALVALEAKRDHLRARARMAGRTRVRRIPEALEELRAGRYRRFSSSYLSAVKDVLLG